jgi:hypothetical protein
MANGAATSPSATVPCAALVEGSVSAPALDRSDRRWGWRTRRRRPIPAAPVGEKRTGTFLTASHPTKRLAHSRPVASTENAVKTYLATLALVVAFVTPGLAADQVEKAPPTGAYKKVSDLVKIPDFLPGLGQLYVDPKTLPAGPFLAYDREGRLVSTIYMLPVDELTNKDKRFDDLASPGGNVDHVDVYFNAGHPGVEKPHSHVVLWHVSKADEARVAK